MKNLIEVNFILEDLFFDDIIAELAKKFDVNGIGGSDIPTFEIIKKDPEILTEKSLIGHK